MLTGIFIEVLVSVLALNNLILSKHHEYHHVALAGIGNNNPLLCISISINKNIQAWIGIGIGISKSVSAKH